MIDFEEKASQLLDLARAAGAEQAVAVVRVSDAIEASARSGAIEGVGRSETLDVGVRALIGRRQACVSASSVKDAVLRELAERAVTIAREASEDPWCGLPDKGAQANDTDAVGLELVDPAEASPEELRETALALDAAASAVQGVDRAESTDAYWTRNTAFIVDSNGFSGHRRGTFWGMSATAIAGEGLDMERDYAYATARWRDDLRPLADVATEAGERSVARLSPRKAPTTDTPILYDRRLAASLIGHMLSAVNGASVARGSSFLAGRMGEALFPKAVTITDDPLKPRGLASRPFDGEGLACAPLTLVKDGVLNSWLLDCAAARRLELTSTASASFSIGAPPHPASSNIRVASGARSRADMIASLKNGFLVTELLGASINPTTGDYSRGASGLWIENGEIAYPVTEATIVGNLLEMFAAMEFADDPAHENAIAAPTTLVTGMHVAGA